MAALLSSKENRQRLLEKELERILPEIKQLGVKKVILFGSLVSGPITRTSDIDLIIVKETEKRFLDRLDEFYTRLKPNVAMDILVYTPKELEEMKQNSSFVRRALREGQVLYEA